MVSLHSSIDIFSYFKYISFTQLLTYPLIGIGGVGIVLGMAPDGSFRPVPAAIAEQVLSSMSAAGAGGGSHRANGNAQRRNAISGPPSGDPL